MVSSYQSSGIHAVDRNRACIVYSIGYNNSMKVLRFLADSHKSLRNFPKNARQNAGRQLLKVQKGNLPDDFKQMSDVGNGVVEIRVWEESGTFRVMYVAKFVDAVYVLHAFQKKTRATSKRDKEIARLRYKQLMRGDL
jgi:phage-related protein